jgi:hypothetical protein
MQPPLLLLLLSASCWQVAEHYSNLPFTLLPLPPGALQPCFCVFILHLR